MLVALGLAVSGCNSSGTPNAAATKAPAQVAATSTTVTTAPTTTSTTIKDAAPAGTPIAAPADGLGRGASGPAVQQLRQRLFDLRFDVNPGTSFDTATYWAVVAFQKQQGLPRTGRADAVTIAQVTAAQLGAAMLPTGEPTRVEIDLKRQMLQYWIDGRLTKVLPVSTGSGRRYCIPASKGGGCAVAVTPGGSFRVERKIRGLRVSKLGELYNPVYFNGGIAIHGEPAVPNTPASHGCVRIPMGSSLWMFNSLQIGTPVYVLGGKAAPVPFNEQAPDDPAAITTNPPAVPAAPVVTTPTTAPVYLPPVVTTPTSRATTTMPAVVTTR